jgi:hypothetical protein
LLGANGRRVKVVISGCETELSLEVAWDGVWAALMDLRLIVTDNFFASDGYHIAQAQAIATMDFFFFG